MLLKSASISLFPRGLSITDLKPSLSWHLLQSTESWGSLMFAKMFLQTSAACCGVQSQRCSLFPSSLHLFLWSQPNKSTLLFANSLKWLLLHCSPGDRLVVNLLGECVLRLTPPLFSFISLFEKALLLSLSLKSEMPLVRVTWQASEMPS